MSVFVTRLFLTPQLSRSNKASRDVTCKIIALGVLYTPACAQLTVSVMVAHSKLRCKIDVMVKDG